MNNKNGLSQNTLDQMLKEVADVESGRVAAARVIEWSEDEDGKLIRKEVDPNLERQRARIAWKAKNEIAKLRQELDFSQKAFAERLGIPLPTLRKWEGNKTKPSGAAASLLKIVKAKPEVLEILEKA